MSELIRDTTLGEILRLVTGRRILKYPEEEEGGGGGEEVGLGDREKGDVTFRRRYLHERKTRNAKDHGDCDDLPVKSDDVGGGGGGDHRREGHEQEQEQGGLSTDRRESRDDYVNQQNGGLDVMIVDWDQSLGANDPENPQNWSSGRKFFVTFLICLLTFAVYIGSAIYTAGVYDIIEQFGVSQVASTAGLTTFVAGYGIGPMIWSPLSEMPQIGRNPIYIWTLVIFVVLQFGVIYVQNFAQLLIFRFLTGFFGSPALATGGASLCDIYPATKRAYAIAIWSMAAVSGPVLGPLVGGFAAEKKGWTWPIWELTWLSGAAMIVLVIFLPETSTPNILYRRARRLAKLSGVDNLKCEAEIESDRMSRKEKFSIALIRPFSLSFTEPILFWINLYTALLYGLLYIWFESFHIVFIEIYGFSLGKEGLVFLGILVGTLVVIPPLFWYMSKYQEPYFSDQGEIKPELRLLPGFVGAFCIPICLFWFGWTSRESVHWIVPIIGTALFAIGDFLLFNSVMNYIGDAYPTHSASAYAGNDFMRSCFGAGFPLFANAMFTNLGVPWASSTLAFISVAFIPIPFILYYYGETIRKRSKMARHDL
ncbi:hypothetical protein DSL72_003481 [Monilinia vaccinii-corymbosi]|uniref:Major facilitator superfamily (MFS) profile domain-containing protein n=1 Tax=Monilinia vaccinii-corymbosi TaxID=61207 RepID=A0A8A3NWX8_9HELO|nr:hypothetical protein DSL72_003481 [Monilinia vaccinii-corymbosi]